MAVATLARILLLSCEVVRHSWRRVRQSLPKTCGLTLCILATSPVPSRAILSPANANVDRKLGVPGSSQCARLCENENDQKLPFSVSVSRMDFSLRCPPNLFQSVMRQTNDAPVCISRAKQSHDRLRQRPTANWRQSTINQPAGWLEEVTMNPDRVAVEGWCLKRFFS